jgi:hypothetical protein
LQEQKLRDLSKIELKYFVGPSVRGPSSTILVVKYTGVYRYGSDGNPDARYMCALGKAGVWAYDPAGVIHDLSDLRYQWGDMLDLPLGVAPECDFAPVAYVVGPKCEEAVRTLFLGLHSDQPLESIGSVFRDLESAWAYINDKLALPTSGA